MTTDRVPERPVRTRRRFLKDAAGAAVGVTCGLPLLGAGCGGGGEGRTADSAGGRQWALVVDVEKCRSEAVRRACIAACETAHNVPHVPDAKRAVRWIWSERYEDVFPELVHGRTALETREAPVLVLCNHCTNPPCVRVCPTQATWKRESDGIVMMDMHRCIGCRYCMAACPYGARSFNWSDPRPHVARGADGRFPSDFPTRTQGVVEKCNLCAERIAEGLRPACVEAAAEVDGGAGALAFGDLSDPGSDASRALREKRTVTRRTALGSGPNVFYVV